MLEDLSEDDRAMYETYGVLYNYPAAETACPPGTHLPTDEEWHALESFFSDNDCGPNRTEDWNDTYECQSAGVVLKSTTTWNGGENTNDSGFSIVASGCRNGDNHDFRLKGSDTYFWSNNLASSGRPLFRSLRSTQLGVRRSNFNQSFGMSIRCVQ